MLRFAYLALAAACVTGAMPGHTATQPDTSADLILTNGRIYTVDSARPWAEAVAIAGTRIVAVGSASEVAPSAGPRTRIIDLQGAFASPGFNDAHVHMDSTGMLITGVNLLDVHEPVAFAERIAAATTRLPKGSWILRGDWGAYEQWGQGSSGAAVAGASDRGPFTPDRRLIDKLTPDHPVLVSRFDRSMFLANSRALELAGISADTPDPAGGEIARDASGRITGVLRGSAVDLVQSVIPPMPFEQRLVGVRAVLAEAREGGVTTIQDLTGPEQLRAYQTLKAAGELT
ncbi:MAG: amidohydrolase family protein, partial [Pseudomonadales bacterium]|nr:amidohydrolase family protein [Pseudomonadales bacterium]